ncbi:hypothetical protein SDC9_164000 [bioreactor metagenome]|uniref:Uncharacterized protein n=1 Tax=bioreactor metagenome TaxID=1076179 RepID=A0A645FQF4_9ZZZZ
MLPFHVHPPDVVEKAVVAFADCGVDRPGLSADVGVVPEHEADEGLRGCACAEGIGEEDGGLEGSHLLDLNKADRLAEAVDDMARRQKLIPEEVPPVGKKCGDPRLYGPVGQGAVPHKDPLHIGDGVPGSPGQGADGYSVIGHAFLGFHRVSSSQVFLFPLVPADAGNSLH